MIRSAVDFALKNRLLVLAVATLLFIWGVISFRSLPVEAYPDVANNYVQVITQWPGISAEQVEQQITIPLEIADQRHSASGASAVGFSVRPFEPDR
jgi:cobalt-zinc-cadmium resistance protein CzcA